MVAAASRAAQVRIIVGFNDGNGIFDIRIYNNPDGDYYYVNSLAGDFNDDGYIDFAGRGSGFVDVWLYDPSVPTTFTRVATWSAAGRSDHGDS